MGGKGAESALAESQQLGLSSSPTGHGKPSSDILDMEVDNIQNTSSHSLIYLILLYLQSLTNQLKQPLSFTFLHSLYGVLDTGGTDISIDQHTLSTMSSSARLVRHASTQRALRSTGMVMIKFPLLYCAHKSFRCPTLEDRIYPFFRSHRFPSS